MSLACSGEYVGKASGPPPALCLQDPRGTPADRGRGMSKFQFFFLRDHSLFLPFSLRLSSSPFFFFRSTLFPSFFLQKAKIACTSTTVLLVSTSVRPYAVPCSQEDEDDEEERLQSTRVRREDSSSLSHRVLSTTTLLSCTFEGRCLVSRTSVASVDRCNTISRSYRSRRFAPSLSESDEETH